MKSQVQMYQDVQAIVNRGGYRQAIDELQNLLRVYPQFALAHNDLGVLLYQQGDKECALSHYEQAAEIQPANITFQKNLADFYYVEQGRVEDALRIYVRILENHPEDVETLLITGHICVALQKFDDAKDFYRRVLQIEPWNSGASENLDKIEKILAGTTTGPDADQLYREAQQMALADRNQEAIDQLEKLVASSPEFAMAHNDLGVLYYKTGRKEKACQHYEEAARLEPGNMIFLKNLADYYCVELSRFEAAMKLYVKVLANNPEDVETLLAVGYICENLNKADDAKEFYNRVIEIEPWHMEARQKLDTLNGSEMAASSVR